MRTSMKGRDDLDSLLERTSSRVKPVYTTVVRPWVSLASLRRAASAPGWAKGSPPLTVIPSMPSTLFVAKISSTVKRHLCSKGWVSGLKHSAHLLEQPWKYTTIRLPGPFTRDAGMTAWMFIMTSFFMLSNHKTKKRPAIRGLHTVEGREPGGGAGGGGGGGGRKAWP